MFGVVPFYHGTIRKYDVLFGAIFRDTTIRRFTSAGAVEKTIQVPIAHASKEKYIIKGEEHDQEKELKMVLPRMSFEMTGLSFDSSRAGTPATKMRYVGGAGAQAQYRPVPWDLEYTLYIKVKHHSDALQIIENILPFFDPHCNLPVENINGMDNGPSFDIPLILTGISPQYDYEGAMDSRRQLTWTLTFTMKAWLFRPHADTSGLIKRAIVNFYDYDDTDREVVQKRITVEVDPFEADFEDEWEVVTTIKDFPED